MCPKEFFDGENTYVFNQKSRQTKMQCTYAKHFHIGVDILAQKDSNDTFVRLVTLFDIYIYIK